MSVVKLIHNDDLSKPSQQFRQEIDAYVLNKSQLMIEKLSKSKNFTTYALLDDMPQSTTHNSITTNLILYSFGIYLNNAGYKIALSKRGNSSFYIIQISMKVDTVEIATCQKYIDSVLTTECIENNEEVEPKSPHIEIVTEVTTAENNDNKVNNVEEKTVENTELKTELCDDNTINTDVKPDTIVVDNTKSNETNKKGKKKLAKKSNVIRASEL